MRESWRLDQARHVELRILADDAHVGHADGVAIQRQAYGPRIAERVVEEPDVEPLDRGVHEQVIEIGELADDANRATRDGRRVRRQLRLERAQRRDPATCR